MEFEARRLELNSTIVGVRISNLNTQNTGRTPIHIALLLDTSGSMEGDRIEAVRQTLRVLIARLSDTDRLTLITYNSQATCLCAAESDKDQLRAYVDSLHAVGGTNLEAALLVLAEQAELPQAVFLLTDGHINQGARSSAALGNLVKSALKGQSIPVNTLGYGVDHAASILQNIALTTRGTYTFAEEAELIPTVVGDMLAAVETVTLRNVHLKVGAEGAGTRCLELSDTPASQTYWLGNLISDKTYWAVFDVPPTAGTAVTLTAENLNGEALELSIHIQHVHEYQTDIAEQWFRCRVVKALHHANQHHTGHAAASVIGRLVALRHEMDASPVAGTPLITQLQSSITDMIKQLEDTRENPAAALRMMSNVTTMGTQRGLLVPEAVGAAHDIDTLQMFQSPRQRYVSNTLVSGFSQAITEEP